MNLKLIIQTRKIRFICTKEKTKNKYEIKIITTTTVLTDSAKNRHADYRMLRASNPMIQI